MSWLAALPLIGKFLGKAAEKVLPDRQAERLKKLEIELETVRQGRGRITPRMAWQHIFNGVCCLLLAMGLAKLFFPGISMDHLLDVLKALLPVAEAIYAF